MHTDNHGETFGKPKDDYISKGKIESVVRDLPSGFHKGAAGAAIVVNCVREQRA